jgi:hypothetical protein
MKLDRFPLGRELRLEILYFFGKGSARVAKFGCEKREYGGAGENPRQGETRMLESRN